MPRKSGPSVRAEDRRGISPNSRIPRWTRRARCAAVASLVAVALTGCAQYRPRPLSGTATVAALRDPAHAALVREAARLRMAPLAPIHLDFRRPLSARELGVIAVLANPDLITLRARERVATAQVFAAGLLPNPIVTAEGLTPYGSRSAGRTTAYSGGFLWDLSQLFARRALLRGVQESARATDFRVAWQEWGVANQTRLLATRLYWLERSRATADLAARAGRLSAQQIREAARAGALPAAATTAAQALALSAQTTAAVYDRQAQRIRVELNELLGLGPNDRLRIAPPQPVPRTMPPPGVLFRTAIQDRLDLVALRAAYAASESRLELAVLDQFPQIGIGLAAVRNTSGVTSAGWQVSFSLPLNGNRGAIAVARANRAVLYHAYMARLAHDRSDVYRLHALFASVTAEIVRLRPQERSFEQLRDAARRARVRGALDMLQALQMTLTSARAQEQLNNLRMLRAESYVGLVVASGARWRE